MRRTIRHSLVITMLLLVGCGTNPVTGKRELQFISTPGEIKIGQQNYAPSRQVQGGDYVVDTELTLYVQRVGNRLAKASDRDLPYEFRVINSSVPNAWALPGGKIAINRGLLLELNSEAELAAVLGHEIVHAAARHGAKSQERGMIMQGGLLANDSRQRDGEPESVVETKPGEVCRHPGTRPADSEVCRGSEPKPTTDRCPLHRCYYWRRAREQADSLVV